MAADLVITEVLEQYKQVTMLEFTVLPAEKTKDRRCKYAKQLQVCLNEICQKAFNQPNRLSINEAYLCCFLKYMEWRNTVPKQHRNLMSERGHPCIWHTFEKTFLRLQQTELMLSDAIIFTPPTPLPPPSMLPGSFAREETE